MYPYIRLFLPHIEGQQCICIKDTYVQRHDILQRNRRHLEEEVFTEDMIRPSLVDQKVLLMRSISKGRKWHENLKRNFYH